MKLFIKDVGVKLPTQANEDDAGYDIVATSGPTIVGDIFERPVDRYKLWKRVAYIEYGTNLFVAPEDEESLDWTHVTDGGGEQPAVLWTMKFHLLMHPRSSVSKVNLVLANSIGLIDHGYRNQISARFKYIFQPEDLVTVQELGATRIYGNVNDEHIYHTGDKIAQIKASPNIPMQFELVKELPTSQRGMGGFGSSGA